MISVIGFVVLAIIIALVLYMMIGGLGNPGVQPVGQGGVRAHGAAIPPPLSIPFNINNVRFADKLTFTIDFSEVGRLPFLRRGIGDQGFLESNVFARVGYAIMRGYDSTISSLISKLSRNGRAFQDDSHPVLLEIEFYTETNQTFSTSILIYHSNLYGYCFKVMGLWKRFRDSPYALINEVGNMVSDVGADSSYTVDCFHAVGISSICRALRRLNSRNSPRIWKESCLHLCFCFIEAARFTEVYRLVRYSLNVSLIKEESLYTQVPVSMYYLDLVHAWGTLSHALTDLERTQRWTLPERTRNLLSIAGPEEDQIAQVREMLCKSLMSFLQRF